MKQQLMLIAMLSVGTALTTMGRLKPVAASLTPPVSYDYSYTWNATASEQYLNVNGVDSIPLYTRTADGVYYDYVSTFNVIDGLDVTMDFQRSNSTWQVSGTSYKPDEAKIGSDNTVGDVGKKFDIKFDNQTNKDYLLYLDLSTTNMTIYADMFLNSQRYITTSSNRIVFEAPASQLYRIYLSSFSNLNIYSTAWFSQARYFDAWYLQDLGISESYQQGLDAETDGILTDYLGTDAQQIGWVLIVIAAILFAFKGGK
jgi:hypothetical protein